jgi:exopolysaccharide biosynthesis protein
MKRFVILSVVVLCSVCGVFAQDADSLAFATARRSKFRVKSAEAYTISADIFSSPQTISVVKFSLDKFMMKPSQTGKVATTSDHGWACKADFAINACFWAVKKSVPTTYVKADGVTLSTSHRAGLPRVNGLLLMHPDRVEVVPSTDMPEYNGLVEDCANVIACGPVLIDDGRRVSYTHITTSQDPSLKRKIPFFLRRHPRSAVGCNDKGEVILVVVDGRSADNAAGATIEELTDICSWLGMVEALNLDGGGSSALWSKKHGVLNHPCDNRQFDHEGERRVMSALVVKRKK